MSKSKLLLLIVCLFLVQATTVTSLDIRTYPLNLNRKVSPTETSLGDVFLKEFSILTFALGLYELDAGKRLTKEDIKEQLIENSKLWEEEFDISFDLDKIDFKRKGFTRYYPFSVNGKDFIIRIFRIREKHFLPKCDVFYEGVLGEPEVAFQIIPGLNSLLKDRKLRKVEFFDPTLCSTHP